MTFDNLIELQCSMASPEDVVISLEANRDAVLTGAHLGFDPDSSLTYAADGEAVDAMSATLTRYVKDVRKSTKRGFTSDEHRDAVDGK